MNPCIVSVVIAPRKGKRTVQVKDPAKAKLDGFIANIGYCLKAAEGRVAQRSLANRKLVVDTCSKQYASIEKEH